MPIEKNNRRYTYEKTQYTLSDMEGVVVDSYPLFSSKKDFMDYFHMREKTNPHIDCIINIVETVRVESLNDSFKAYTTTFTQPLTVLKRDGELTSGIARIADAWFNEHLPCYYHRNAPPFHNRVELFAHYIGSLLQDNEYEDGDGLHTNWEIDTLVFHDNEDGEMTIPGDIARELNTLSKKTIFTVPTLPSTDSLVTHKDYDEQTISFPTVFTWEHYDTFTRLGSVYLNVYDGESFTTEPDIEILTQEIAEKIVDLYLCGETPPSTSDTVQFFNFVERMAIENVSEYSDDYFYDITFYTESILQDIFKVKMDFPKARLNWDLVGVELDKSFVKSLITEGWKEELKKQIAKNLDDRLKNKLQDAQRILEVKTML